MTEQQDSIESDDVDEANPYQLEPSFSMELRGDWQTGGVLEFFRDKQRLDFIKLSPAPWAILADLFLAGVQSQTTHWMNGYVPTDRLADRLEQEELTATTAKQTVYRLVNGIRNRLARRRVRKRTGSGHIPAKDWAALLIDKSGSLGYRIGLPPSQLRLAIGETEFPAESELRRE